MKYLFQKGILWNGSKLTSPIYDSEDGLNITVENFVCNLNAKEILKYCKREKNKEILFISLISPLDSKYLEEEETFYSGKYLYFKTWKSKLSVELIEKMEYCIIMYTHLTLD